MMFQAVIVNNSFPQRPVVLEGELCLRLQRSVGDGSGSWL